jgi:hypothetical protein
MKVITENYNVYHNIHRRLSIDEKTIGFGFNGIQIMENGNFYYVFNLFGLFEIIIVLDKRIKKENNFKNVLDYLNKNKSYEIKIIKRNVDSIKEFLLKIMSAGQLDNIIKKKEEAAFEKGKMAKIREIKDIFEVR